MISFVLANDVIIFIIYHLRFDLLEVEMEMEMEMEVGLSFCSNHDHIWI